MELFTKVKLLIEGKTFDCALCGPFDNLFPARLSAPRALCEVMTAVISASTVSIDYVFIIAL